MLDQQLLDGSFIISTEVANENVRACIDEIHHEMKMLQNEHISLEEISLVRNYMMGNYLNLFDGPFNSLKAIKSLVLSDIPLDKLSAHIQASINIGADEVMAMAQKYFNTEDFWEVVVGTQLA
jgi:predicted Zn-dependent peptidase